jgi:hypothetical protein
MWCGGGEGRGVLGCCGLWAKAEEEEEEEAALSLFFFVQEI